MKSETAQETPRRDYSVKDPAAIAIAEAIAPCIGVPVEQILAEVEARKRRDGERIERNNARFNRALDNTTPEQAATIAALEATGARRQSGIRQDRRSGNIVVFLQAQKYNPAKGRVGTKLFAVYPDGTRAETFERSISVRSEF